MIYNVWFNLSFCVETSKGEVALISAIALPDPSAAEPKEHHHHAVAAGAGVGAVAPAS